MYELMSFTTIYNLEIFFKFFTILENILGRCFKTLLHVFQIIDFFLVLKLWFFSYLRLLTLLQLLHYKECPPYEYTCNFVHSQLVYCLRCKNNLDQFRPIEKGEETVEMKKIFRQWDLWRDLHQLQLKIVVILVKLFDIWKIIVSLVNRENILEQDL